MLNNCLGSFSIPSLLGHRTTRKNIWFQYNQQQYSSSLSMQIRSNMQLSGGSIISSLYFSRYHKDTWTHSSRKVRSKGIQSPGALRHTTDLHRTAVNGTLNLNCSWGFNKQQIDLSPRSFRLSVRTS